MSVEQLLVMVIVGGLVGLLAERFIRGTRMGIVGAVVVGIVGSFIGNWLFRQLHVRFISGLIGEVATAFLGACLLLIIIRSFRR